MTSRTKSSKLGWDCCKSQYHLHITHVIRLRIHIWRKRRENSLDIDTFGLELETDVSSFFLPLLLLLCFPRGNFLNALLTREGSCLSSNVHRVFQSLCNLDRAIYPHYFRMTMNPLTNLAVGCLISLGGIITCPTVLGEPWFFWTATLCGLFPLVSEGVCLSRWKPPPTW